MDPADRLKRINIYDFMLASLAVLAVLGILSGNWGAGGQVLLVPIAAAVLDALINKFFFGRTIFPKSAVITGLIVALVIAPGNVLTALGAVVFAVLGKHVLAHFRLPGLNPAALGLVFSSVFFHSSNSWWGAGVSFLQPATFLVVVFPLLVSWKMGKLPLALSFLLANLLVSAAYFGIGSLFSAASVLTALGFSFFAGFMLTDPRTSTRSLPAMLAQGILVALAGAGMGWLVPSLTAIADPLLLSLLASNIVVPFLNRRPA